MKKMMAAVVMAAVWTGPAWSDKGVAEVLGTAAGSSIKGSVRFEDTAEGLEVNAKMTGVPPGLHGFHIHEFGDCGDTGKAAGGHYNPMSMPHGDVLKSGPQHAHVGDMGNITAGANGEATLSATLKNVTLSGTKNAIGGRAIILHEKGDDFSQPTGNAGGRIGCGPVIITSH